MSRRARYPLWAAAAVMAGVLTAGPLGLVVATVVVASLALVGLRMAATEPVLPDVPRLLRSWRGRVRPGRRDRREVPGFGRPLAAVDWGLRSPYDFDTSLRPALQRVLAVRLRESAGIDLQRDPAAARAALGDDEVWQLLDPARPAVRDRAGTGPDARTVQHILDVVERVGAQR